MKIDAHQHFWQYNPLEHTWMTNHMQVLKQDFMPTDLLPLLHSAHFDGCIAVQARQSFEETKWLLSLAKKHEFIKGVVGWIDLLSPSIKQTLTSLANSKQLVGVRHVVHDEPDDCFMLRHDFQRGIAALKKYNLTYDLLIFPRHVLVAAELVKSFPEQLFVIDHIAKPLIKNKLFHSWARDLKVLASFPNVYCKLSGIITEADWYSWRKEDFTQYLDVVLDFFGTDRVMIGSDWPVCTLAANYQDTMNIVIEYTAQFDAKTKAKIFGGNCINFYGIQ